jgi:hypothetical protein
MVTEMTSGYPLLVPATLAVMVSYVIQVAVSRPLRHRSLYEAQVSGRAESAAHTDDYLDAAVRLMEAREADGSESELIANLRALLASRKPLEAADGSELRLVPVLAGSAGAGLPLRECLPANGGRELEAMAVFRDNQVLSPSPELVLLAGDRLLFSATAPASERLAERLTPLAPKSAAAHADLEHR